MEVDIVPVIPSSDCGQQKFDLQDFVSFLQETNQSTMQVEFVIAQNADSPTFSLEKKVGSLVKSYRPRTVQLTSNSLKVRSKSYRSIFAA